MLKCQYFFFHLRKNMCRLRRIVVLLKVLVSVRVTCQFSQAASPKWPLVNHHRLSQRYKRPFSTWLFAFKLRSLLPWLYQVTPITSGESSSRSYKNQSSVGSVSEQKSYILRPLQFSHPGQLSSEHNGLTAAVGRSRIFILFACRWLQPSQTLSGSRTGSATRGVTEQVDSTWLLAWAPTTGNIQASEI